MSRNFDGVDIDAEDFTKTLRRYVSTVFEDVEDVITETILEVLFMIAKRSPVLTGKFKASNSLATGTFPGNKSGVFRGKFSGGTRDERSAQALDYLKEKVAGFDWKVEDGTIWIYNNASHALRVETGISPRAPEGVYAVSLAAFEQILQKRMKEYRWFN